MTGEVYLGARKQGAVAQALSSPVSPRTLGSTHVAFGCSQDSFPGAPRQPLGVPLPFELLHQEIKGLPLTGGDENLVHQCRHR